MPTIQQGAKILVTGANGYIAMWVVRKLLEKGYSVRATVRSLSKGAHMLEYFKSYGNKLELIAVPDITQDGAFDDVVKGIEGIEHTASPSHWEAKTPRDIIDPAVNGTLSILKSAQKYGTDVKRIVVSSSIASVTQFGSPNGRTCDHNTWNDEAVRIVEELGHKAHPRDMYSASKTLADKAAWDFYNEHKSTLQWDLTVLNIPCVFGPPIQEVSSLKTLNGSMKIWWNMTIATLPDAPDSQGLLACKTPWANVRDVGEAHAASLEQEAAGGERIIVTSGDFTWYEWVDAVNALDSSLLPGGKPVQGLASVEKINSNTYDEAKVNRILGIKWASKVATAKEIMEDAAGRGWLLL